MLIREHFEIKETAVTIITDPAHMSIAKDAIFEARAIIEHKISEDPFFGLTYDPYPVSNDDDELIRRMCEASVKAAVGPMAAVAGAVASYAVEALRRAGSTYCVVENGGDIALITDRDVTIGLFSGNEELKDISVRIPPTPRIYGVCSSSGKIGPSVSFGSSDICTVFSSDPILADAAATRLGNLVKDDDIADALETVGNIDDIDSCIVFKDGKVALYGDVPELVRSRFSDDDITRVMH